MLIAIIVVLVIVLEDALGVLAVAGHVLVTALVVAVVRGVVADVLVLVQTLVKQLVHQLVLIPAQVRVMVQLLQRANQ